MDAVEALLRGLDRALAGHAPPRPELRIVGSTALFAQTTWRRGTKDCDAVLTWRFDPDLQARLLGMAGRASPLAIRHGIYLEFVGQGMLLLPPEPNWRPWLSLANIDLLVLDPTDTCVAKLARLHGDDRHDIEAMVVRGVVSHGQLVERFREAIIQHGQQGMGHKVPRAIENLHRVERDIFLVDESTIAIPDWSD